MKINKYQSANSSNLTEITLVVKSKDKTKIFSPLVALSLVLAGAIIIGTAVIPSEMVNGQNATGQNATGQNATGQMENASAIDQIKTAVLKSLEPQAMLISMT